MAVDLIVVVFRSIYCTILGSSKWLLFSVWVYATAECREVAFFVLVSSRGLLTPSNVTFEAEMVVRQAFTKFLNRLI